MSIARWFRQLVQSAALILLLVCAAEVALQYAAYRASCQTTGPTLSQFVTPDDRLGQRLVPTAVMGDLGLPLEINARGLRGAEIDVPKPAETYRVLCLGDEWLLAPTTPLEQTFPQQFQQALQARCGMPVEVINAGTPGYCPLLSYLWLRHEGTALAPDLIVLHLEPNDFQDESRARAYVINDAAGRPVLCPAFSGPRETPLRPDGFLWQTHLGRLAKGVVIEHVAGSSPAEGERRLRVWKNPETETARLRGEQMLETIRQTRQLADAMFATLVLVVHPGDGDVADAARLIESTWLRELSQCCAAEQLPLLVPELSLHRENTRASWQLTREQHGEIARQLEAFVTANVSGPWSSAYFQSPSPPMAAEAWPARR